MKKRVKLAYAWYNTLYDQALFHSSSYHLREREPSFQIKICVFCYLGSEGSIQRPMCYQASQPLITIKTPSQAPKQTAVTVNHWRGDKVLNAC